MRWRLLGTPASATFAELFRRYPFTVVDEGDHHLVPGLCGRVWTIARRLAGPEKFAGLARAGTVRVLFAHRVEETGDGRSVLVSETRVQPVDHRAAVRLRAVWALVGRFERLIGAEPLPVALRRAAPRTTKAARWAASRTSCG